MSYNFENLTEETRKAMLDEVKADIAANRIYLSKRFNENGRQKYLPILLNVVEAGDEEYLSMELKKNGCFSDKEERKTKSGVSWVKVPETAHVTFAEGEFNRYYMRGLCVIALKYGYKLQVYRARSSDNPRIESEMLIGRLVDPQKLLNDLTQNIGLDTVLGLPPGPNSGLSIRLLTDV